MIRTRFLPLWLGARRRAPPRFGWDTASPDGRRSAELKGTARQRLLDAALVELREHGYEGTSLQAIARRAGLSKGAIYWSFRDKRDLFLALIEERLDAAAQQLMATTKHYVCNDQEINRFGLSVQVDERTLREIYLPPYESAVKLGNTAAIMSAENLVNGVYNSAKLISTGHAVPAGNGRLQRQLSFFAKLKPRYRGRTSPDSDAIAS